MPNKIEKILAEIAASPGLLDLWATLVGFMGAQGFNAIAYYLLNAESRLPSTIPLYRGFPDALMETYAAYDFRRLDVVPRIVLARGVASSWMEIWRETRLTAAEAAFYAALRHADMQDGYCLPCYGPNGSQAMLSIGMMTPQADRSETALLFLNNVAQAAHMRICTHFFRQGEDNPQLSMREKEILEWVARGKSNSVIAEILQISSGTVDTYLRRIYDKLDVSDRTSAAVRGVGLGLIAA